jgi:hypothetical protein
MSILTFQRLTSVADPHHVDVNPDPACPFDADPDPSFQIKAQNLKSAQIGSYSIHFDLSSATN